jgi:transcriptional regulator with XRE-family HTH domain
MNGSNPAALNFLFMGPFRQRLRDAVDDYKEEHGVTQGELADKLGMSETHLANLLNGHTGGVKDIWIEKLTKIMGVDIVFLFSDRRERDQYSEVSRFVNEGNGDLLLQAARLLRSLQGRKLSKKGPDGLSTSETG